MTVLLIHLGISFPRVIQKYTKICKAIFYLFYNILQPNFCNFTKYKMLFQAVIKYLRSSIFFQNSAKKVKGLLMFSHSSTYEGPGITPEIH